MNRRSLFIFARRLAVSLVLGVLLTFAAAWIIAGTVETGGGVNSMPSGIGDVWSYWTDRGFGTVQVKRLRAHFEMKEPLKQDYLAVRARTVPRWSAVYRAPREDEPAGVTFIEDARGWPLVSLSSESVVTPDRSGDGSGRINIVAHGGISFTQGDGRTLTRRVVLPLRPIWPRFLLNVLTLGAGAFAVVFGPGIVRRLVRRRIGHCEGCGYNLKGVLKRTVCPECGTQAAG